MHLLVALLLLLALSVRADPLPGRSDARFRAALATWLADDDAAALPALAGLAAEGNRAAQVLVALIDRTPTAQGPWLTRRPRGSGWR